MRAATAVVLLSLACARTAPPPAAPAPLPVRPAVAPSLPLERALDDPAWPDELRALYAARDFEPLFVVAGAPRAETVALLDAFDALEGDGLPPLPGAARARALLGALPHTDSLAAFELLLASLWLDAARGLSGGRVHPAHIDSSWAVEPVARDLSAMLSAAARDERLVAALADMRPVHPGYAALRDALARHPEHRQQLAANLERWRWLPPQLVAPYIMVNIPAYELRVVEAGGAEATSRVILGRTDWQTPLLHSVVTHVVLAPPWRVPDEIARREIFPLMRVDSGYVRRMGIQVYRDSASRPVDPALVDWSAPDSTLRVRLVQPPGPSNPLGRVKLVFANQFAVALHDTPAQELFGTADRALSHGCVRVESALELAARLLRDAPGWDHERVTRVASAWTTRWVALPQPVPVYVTYFTAWVDADGVLQLRDDVYGWDAKLAGALGF